MNYDIASKLNFFRDSGEYRLPEPIEFNTTGDIEFINTIVSGTPQTNWINYWKDSLQTFEYNTISGLDESKKVLFSTLFKSTGVFGSDKPTLNTSDISIELNEILPLVPEIEEESTNIFYGTTPISPPLTSKDLYLYKNLMIQRLAIAFNNKVDVGDVIRLESDNVETNLIVNKIFVSGSYIYLYMYTGFNQNMIKSIKENGCVLSNLNKYSSIADPNELIEKFNKHPISIAYDLAFNAINFTFILSAKFNNKTAYYNLGTTIETTSGLFDMKYKDSFINFGYSPIYNIYDYLNNINSVLFTPDKEYLAMPIYKNIPLDSLTPSVGYIDTGISNNNKILLGTDLKFEWESVFIDTFVDVDIDIVSQSTRYEFDKVSTFTNTSTGIGPGQPGNFMFVDGGNGFAYSAPATSVVILKI